MRSHPVYASVYDRYNRGAERTWLGEARHLALGHARGRVLEIGAGTGMNLLRYRDVEEVVATEPDPAYRRRLEQRVPEAQVPVQVVDAPAERLPFPDASFDTIVSTLVLCSVDDPARSAAELRRVLRPDGALLLVEHIQTSAGGFTRLAQHASVPFWRLFVGGCRTNRPTLRTVADAGFEVKELDRFHPPHVPFVMFPFVVAVASPLEGKAG
ncbi:class I SAM-dependent methyltransferase [Saccharothrix sp. ALI-22-I]|uniref:class I SAM-dependent methyltransferase n=1 Tax=Saccharothrix sp. ALI-22-I TaxID=1933778 RepID=UPI001EE6CB86|nr:class I SAM-dependent methyltransferase [Saccharothrix sp. ALI-22-I]